MCFGGSGWSALTTASDSGWTVVGVGNSGWAVISVGDS